MSVILSTEGGVSARHCQTPPPSRQPPPRADTPTRADPPGQTPPSLPVTATAADGTHPTGMHSCLYKTLICPYMLHNGHYGLSIVWSRTIHTSKSVTRDSEFKSIYSSGGSKVSGRVPTPEVGSLTYYFANCLLKLRGNERIWRGSCVPTVPPSC